MNASSLFFSKVLIHQVFHSCGNIIVLITVKQLNRFHCSHCPEQSKQIALRKATPQGQL